MDPAFLMQQIELREELEVARSSTDTAVELLGRLAGKVNKEYSNRQASIAEILDNTAETKSAAGNEIGLRLEKARHLVRELQFLNRMRSEIDDAEEALF